MTSAEDLKARYLDTAKAFEESGVIILTVGIAMGS
jgi:hypothetical protein